MFEYHVTDIEETRRELGEQMEICKSKIEDCLTTIDADPYAGTASRIKKLSHALRHTAIKQRLVELAVERGSAMQDLDADTKGMDRVYAFAAREDGKLRFYCGPDFRGQDPTDSSVEARSDALKKCEKALDRVKSLAGGDAAYLIQYEDAHYSALHSLLRSYVGGGKAETAVFLDGEAIERITVTGTADGKVGVETTSLLGQLFPNQESPYQYDTAQLAVPLDLKGE